MRKTLVTLFTAAAIAAPFAHAEGTPITVALEYDASLIATEAGAKSVLKSIKSQATEACSFETPVTGATVIDRDCRKDLVEQAIGKISLAAVEKGQPATYVFAARESTIETTAQ